MIKAIQQIQLRDHLSSMEIAEETLKKVKDAGFAAIELNGYMIRENSLKLRILTRIGGMPVGKVGSLNWHKLIANSGLDVISIHEPLAGILDDFNTVVDSAKKFKAKYIVIPGMHNFDYSNKETVLKLCDDLNKAGRMLFDEGLELLYHNHNSELLKVDEHKSAYELIIENTDFKYVNFEFDSYWMLDGGVDAKEMMLNLGSRLKMHHITDRTVIKKGIGGLILKSASTELGDGNINIKELIEIDKKLNVDAIILETHNNWINDNALESMERSAKFLNKHIKEKL